MSTAQDRINKAVQKSEDGPKQILMSGLYDKRNLALIRSLAPGLDPEGAVAVALSHWVQSPYLRSCTPASIVMAVAEAAKLELTVDGVLGHAYMVPFKDRGVPKAKMMVGYRGYEQLAYRSGKVTRIHTDTIHENDSFAHVEGVEVIFRHSRPPLGQPRGATIGAYATAHLAAGGPPLIAVLDLEEIYARRQSSASFKGKPKDSPWTTHFAEMAKKSAIRALAKKLPVPIIQRAAIRDELRDEGRDDGPVDLGMAEVVEDVVPKEASRAEAVESEKPESCRACGRSDLRDDGSCPDCDPTRDEERP